MNRINAKLVETDLDVALAYKLAPAGCGQCGRYPERGCSEQPAPAGACSDIGADEPDFRAAARFWVGYLAVLLVLTIAGIAAWL